MPIVYILLCNNGEYYIGSTADIIRTHPGVSVLQLNAELGIPSKSLERHISALTKTALIAHRGSKKTGGYYPL